MMPMSKGDKRIYVMRCSFCRHLLLPDGYRCALGLEADDGCSGFEEVESVAGRVEELFGKLPDGAGKELEEPEGTASEEDGADGSHADGESGEI